VATEDALLRGSFAMPIDVAAPVESDAGDLGEGSLGESFEGVDVELPESIEEEVAPDLDMEPDEDVDSDYDFLPEDVVRARRLSDRIDYAWSVYRELERKQERIEWEYGQIPNSEHHLGSTRSLELSSRWEATQGEIRGMLEEIEGLHEERRLGGEVVRRLTSGDPEEHTETADVEGMEPQELVVREAEQWRLFEEVGSKAPDHFMDIIESFPERVQGLLMQPMSEKRVAQEAEDRRIFQDVPVDFWSRVLTGEGTAARRGREWSRQLGLGESTARQYLGLDEAYADAEAALALKPGETFEGTDSGPLLPAIFMSRRAHVPLWNTRISPHLRPGVDDPIYRKAAPERTRLHILPKEPGALAFPEALYEDYLRHGVGESDVLRAEVARARASGTPPVGSAGYGVEVYLKNVDPKALTRFRVHGTGNPWYGATIEVGLSGLPPGLQSKGLGKEAYLRILEFAKLNNATVVSPGPRSPFSEGIYRWMRSSGIPLKAYNLSEFERYGRRVRVETPPFVRPERWMKTEWDVSMMDNMESRVREQFKGLSGSEVRSRVVEAHRKHYLGSTLQRASMSTGRQDYVSDPDKFKRLTEAFYRRYLRGDSKAADFFDWMKSQSAAGFSNGRPHTIPGRSYPFEYMWEVSASDLQGVDLKSLRARVSMDVRKKMGESEYGPERGRRYAESPAGRRRARTLGIQHGRRLGLVKRPVETSPGVVAWFLAPIILTGGVVAAGAKQDVVERYYMGRSVSLGRPLTTDDVSEPMKREMQAKPDIVEALKAGGFISYALYHQLGGRE